MEALVNVHIVEEQNIGFHETAVEYARPLIWSCLVSFLCKRRNPAPLGCRISSECKVAPLSRAPALLRFTPSGIPKVREHFGIATWLDVSWKAKMTEPLMPAPGIPGLGHLI